MVIHDGFCDILKQYSRKVNKGISKKETEKNT